MNTHIAKVEAVSLEDIKRVAARLLIVSDLQIVVVGDPDEAHIPRHIRDPNPQ
jgi:predicted Zn-dependent peptidase